VAGAATFLLNCPLRLVRMLLKLLRRLLLLLLLIPRRMANF